MNDYLIGHVKTLPVATAESASSSPPYEYVCVIDFEATCTETRALGYPHEIIEFPLVLVNILIGQLYLDKL